MPSPFSDAITFLAPGLVHQFGNLLLTIQGHALALDTAAQGHGRARQAILHASDRGGSSLRILRILLGEPGEVLAPVDELLEMFGELARVPVREAGHRLELVGQAAQGRQVAANEFFPGMTAAVRTLLRATPAGVGGRLRIALSCSDSTVHADLQFVADAGNLPFPLQLAERLTALVRDAASRGDRTTFRPHGSGMRLGFAGLPTTGQASPGLHDSFPEAT